MVNFKKYFKDEDADPRAIIFISIANLIAQSAQVVILPLFVKSFKDGDDTKKINPYSVVFICSMIFAVFYMVLHLVKVYKYGSPLWTHLQVQSHFLAIGVANAFNGLLVVYSSPDTRTPADLQGILSQFGVPFTFMLSYFLKKEQLIKNQLVGVLIVVGGIIVSFVPMIKSLANGDDEFVVANIWWSLVFILGMLAGSAMNVVEDHVFKKFTEDGIEKTQLLAWINFYQVITVGMMFWADFIPGFGVTDSAGEWASKLKYGFTCIGTCRITWLYTLLFTIAYITTYGSGAYILKMVTANYNIMWNALVAPVTVTFWIAFPSLNSMDISTLTTIMDYVSAIIIVVGIYWYIKDSEDPKNIQETRAPLLPLTSGSV